MFNDTKYKKCKCPELYWEVIIYDHDEDFDDRSTIHHHCDLCGIDFVVEDFYTREIICIYEKGKYKRIKRKITKVYIKKEDIVNNVGFLKTKGKLVKALIEEKKLEEKL